MEVAVADEAFQSLGHRSRAAHPLRKTKPQRVGHPGSSTHITVG
jgi:hypothetical protein